MKKLLSLLTVLFVFQGAQATSIMGNVLTYEVVQKNNQKVVHSLHVYTNGAVVHRADGLNGKLLTNLSAHQVDSLERLVRRSTPVQRVFERSQIMCFAPSFTTEKYQASNYSVLLKVGAACDGGYTVNNRPAARKLVRFIQTLENAAHKRFASAELESSLDAILE